MKALNTWMLIAATVILGLFAGLSANAQEFMVKVSSSDEGHVHFAVTNDRRVVKIVCKTDLLRSAKDMQWIYSADVVFPNEDRVFETNFRTQGSRSNMTSKTAYRPLSAEAATEYCANPYGYFKVRVSDTGASIQRSPVPLQAESFGVGRRYL